MKLSHWFCLALGAVLGASVVRLIPWRSFPLVVVLLVIAVGVLVAALAMLARRLR